MTAGSYAERCSSLLPGVVWTRAGEAGRFVVTPDGCMDLIWDGDTLLVAGPDTGPVVGSSATPRSWSAVRLDPGVAPSLLGLPAHPLADLRVPLRDLWPRPVVDAWSERLASADDPAAILEELVAQGLRASEPIPGWVPAVAHRLATGHTVAQTADAVGVTGRQLHRRSVERFGYGPKVLQRVLRLVAAQRDLRLGLPAAETATRHGFSDQPHLHRELRRLTSSGTTSTRR
ncbi:MAG: helix-turn-helix domain-containing protein [Nocardioidaceae bacterium]